MKSKHTMTRILPALAALALAPHAPAAVTITVTPLARAPDSTGSEILNDGTLVKAYNFGDSPTDIIVAEIPFVAGNSGTGSAFPETGLTGASNGMYGWLTGQLGYGFNDANHDQLINQAYVGGSPTLAIGDLTIGQEYRLQIILQETRGIPTIEGTVGPDLTWGNTGIVTATWVAEDSELNMSWNPGVSPHFSGYVLHAIPEPAVAALAGVGLLGLLRRRRGA